MSILVEPCEDNDIDRVFDIISDAFRHTQPYVDAVFPNHDTPNGHAQGRDRMLELKRTDPTVRFLKAVDTKTGQIVGQANWLILDKPPADEKLDGNYWEDDNDKDYAQQLFTQYLVPRTKAIEAAKGPVLVLDILSVDPKSQSAGVGSMLVKWGTKLADHMGAEALVESTMNAVHFYEQSGFRGVGKMRFEFPAKHADRPKPQLLFMRRPAQGKGSQ